jgi:hypothetical protein
MLPRDRELSRVFLTQNIPRQRNKLFITFVVGACHSHLFVSSPDFGDAEWSTLAQLYIFLAFKLEMAKYSRMKFEPFCPNKSEFSQ